MRLADHRHRPSACLWIGVLAALTACSSAPRRTDVEPRDHHTLVRTVFDKRSDHAIPSLFEGQVLAEISTGGHEALLRLHSPTGEMVGSWWAPPDAQGSILVAADDPVEGEWNLEVEIVGSLGPEGAEGTVSISIPEGQPPNEHDLEFSRALGEVGTAFFEAKPSSELHELVGTLEKAVKEEVRSVIPGALEDLGVAMYFEGTGEAQWSVATRVLQAAIRAHENAHSPDLTRIGTEETLAALQFFRGRWSEAESLFRSVVEYKVGHLPEGDPTLAEARQSLAMTLQQLGNYDEAAELLRMALDILGPQPGAGGTDPLLPVEAANALGDLARVRGRYAEAQANFELGLALLRDASEEMSPLHATVLSNLGLLYQDLGRYARAEGLLSRAIQIRKHFADEDPYNLMSELLDQGELYRLLGLYRRAEPVHREALRLAREVLGEENPELVLYVNSLAELFSDLERPEAAEALYREALELARKLGEGNPLLAPESLNDLGVLLLRENRPEEAEPLLERALELRRQAFGVDHPWVATSSAALASALIERSPPDLNRASALLENSLNAFAAEPAYGEDHARALATRAELHILRGRVESAHRDLTQAIDLLESARRQVGGQALRAGYLGRHLDLYDLLFQLLVEKGDLPGAFRLGERVRARVLLEQLIASGISGEIDRSEPSYREFARLEEVQRARLTSLHRKEAELIRRRDLDLRARLRARRETRREINDVSRTLEATRSRLTDLAASQENLPERVASLETLREDLVGLGEWVLYYQDTAEALYLLVVPPRPGKVEIHVLPPFESLGPRPSGASLRRTATNAAVWAGPVLERLVPPDVWERLREARQVLIVPSGDVEGVAFESLLIEEAPRAYWLDLGPVVRYSPSASVLEALSKQTSTEAQNGRAVLVADPSTTGVAHPLIDMLGFERLPGSRLEAEEVREVLDQAGLQVKFLVDSNASEASLRRALDEPLEILHFASHGFVDGNNELLSGLVLASPDAGSDAPEDDGLLQLFEIYDLDFDANLVMLAACETHNGRHQKGEGVFGLSRGFHAAGTPRVISTLWSVEDEATAELVTIFYRRWLVEDTEPTIALRDAKRAIRSRPGWESPFFWAPFVWSGLS